MNNNQNTSIQYRNISLLVRPIKVAILIPREDEYWKYIILNIFKFCSQVWGGANFVIVPTDGKEINPVFWNILEQYNPDQVISFIPTLRDLEYARPRDFELDQLRYKDYLRENFPFLDETQLHDFMVRERLNQNRFSFGIENQLQQQIKHRLSPLYINDFIVQEAITSQLSVLFPLTQIENIVRQGNVEKVYVVDNIDDIDSALYFYSNWGSYSNHFEEEMNKRGVTITHVPHQAKLTDLISFVATKGVEKIDIYYRNQLQQKFCGNDATWSPDEDIAQFSPYEISLLKVGKYKPIGSYVLEDPILLIIGDTVDDFCSYYCLSKIHDDVFWIPEISKPEKDSDESELDGRTILRKAIIQSIIERILESRSSKSLHISSLSLTKSELEDARQLLCILQFINEAFTQRITIDSYPNSVGKLIYRLIEQNNYTKEYTETFQNNRGVGHAQTPKPKNFSEVIPYEHRWVTELNIEGYTPPQLHFLGNKILGLSTSEARVTKTGISYLCPGMAYFGGDIDVTLGRPRITIVEPLAIFQEYFSEAGYLDVRLSDKGGYTQETISKFGSLEELGNFLRTKTNCELLSLFREKKSTKSSQTGEVVFADNRAYINFLAIENILSSEAQAVSLIDSFIRKNIFYRGTMLQCSRCRDTDWFGLDELDQSFVCHRCKHRQTLQQSNWKEGREPTWFYKLDEVFYQGIANNMILPILTIAFLKSKARNSFLYMPELEFRRNPLSSKPDKELDICCIIDGRITVGECRIGKITKSIIDKLITFVTDLPKPPEQLVFSTLLEDVSEEIVSYANSKTKIPINFLKNSDLADKN